MKGKKTIELANFNCTFGENASPMGLYFERVIYPALTSGYEKRLKDGSKYTLEEIELKEIPNFGLVLTGIHVYQTKLEVKSLRDKDDKIMSTDREYDTLPYSGFSLIIKNHRMIHIKNQKGSPSIENFASTCKFFISKYLRELNKGKRRENQITNLVLNITPIPSYKSVDRMFSDIEKVNYVIFRMHQLNGDTDFSEVFEGFREMLGESSSNSGNIKLNSPKDKETVKRLVDESDDYNSVSMRATLENGNIRNFNNNDYKEKIEIILPDYEDDINKNINNALIELENHDGLNKTSKENNTVYLKVKDELLKIIQ